MVLYGDMAICKTLDGAMRITLMSCPHCGRPLSAKLARCPNCEGYLECESRR